MSLALDTELFHSAKDAERQHLCKTIVEVKETLMQHAQAFYDDGRHTQQQRLKVAEEVIQSLDKVTNAGDWQSSLFLRSTIRPLLELREKAIELRDSLLREQGKMVIPEQEIQSNHTKVYISLYQSDGHDQSAWEAQLASISRYISGRPIYRNEADIRKSIRQKLLQNSEAYVVAVVANDQLLGDDFSTVRTDRLGGELLTVQAGAIKECDIFEFIHMNKRYHYFKGCLVIKEKRSVNLWQIEGEN